ncbi:permease [Fusobacterium sp. MFO224]|uniref:permease n=1 Tax=Fusobacterium sp. MFO224 TaxID=3378070 RepID=UPI00385529CA
MFNWLDYLVTLLVEDVFGISVVSSLGGSIHFFIYDVIKILILLGIMIFSISYIRSYFPPERTKKILGKFSGIKGNIMASLLGIVTPFCSCSSVPLFIGFIEGGIPLSVTFSFLITSPIVNEAAFAILLASFGWKIAFVYVITGVFVGVIGGILIGTFKMESYIEEYVFKMQSAEIEMERLNKKERVNFAIENVKEIVGRIWVFLLIGIGLGAIIHGWAPAKLLSKYAGPDNPLAVFIAVGLGIPLYSNALGTIPIAEALIAKGVGIGTALAFMMSTTALSLPEMILLRKVIKPKLIALFISITGVSIIFVGYLFNILAPWLIS